MKCAVEECGVDLKSNGEQSIHYNTKHRGVSYKDLFVALVIENEDGSELNGSKGTILDSKMDKQVRVRN